MNRKISKFLLSFFCIALLTACGSKKKDKCPSMDSGVSNNTLETVINFFK